MKNDAMSKIEFVYRKRMFETGRAIICAAGIVIYLSHLYTVYLYSFLSNHQTVNVIERGNEKDKKIILYWTEFFEYADFGVGFGNQPFLDCPTSNCITTNDRSLLNQSDAIIFHMRNFNFNDLPKHRLPHQRWVFFLLESPHHTPDFFYRLEGIFNWTMTYRDDSDVFNPYGLDRNVIKEKILAESKERETGNFDSKLTNLLSKKSKTVVWVVSNCQAASGRVEYTQELQKYIKVDIYGKCSENRCPDTNCFETLGKQYKFYLSFENSLCQDYVTEKFYVPLLNNMLPIVYGSANYSRIPELNSAYIDARNFSSVKDLAKYLHYLDKNDEAYQKYFEWRRKPNSLSVLPRTQTGWCNLCQMLSESSSTSSSTHGNMRTWWVDQAKCGQDKKIFDDQIKASNRPLRVFKVGRKKEAKYLWNFSFN